MKTDMVGTDSVIDFHNPSVNDYMDSYLAESPDDLADLLQSAAFFEQFQQFWSERRGQVSSWSSKYRDDFLSAFSQRFMAPSCKIVRLYSQGRIVGMHHLDVPFERRVSLAIEVDENLATPASHEFLSQLVATLRKRIKAGEAYKEGLVNLLPALDRRTKVSKSIFASAKQFLTEKLHDLEDFESVANFVDRFPSAVAYQELVKIRQAFEEFSSEYADVSDRDPDVLRSIAEEITNVGDKLNVDVSEWADPLFQSADEIDHERESEPEPEPDDSDRSWFEDSKALRDVDLMFDGLLREIIERHS